MGVNFRSAFTAVGRLNCVGRPVTFVREERSVGLPTPMLGQHTDEVLKKMGLSPETIERLRREYVVIHHCD